MTAVPFKRVYCGAVFEPKKEILGKRTRDFNGVEVLFNGYPFESVDLFVNCSDIGRLPPVRARAGEP